MTCLFIHPHAYNFGTVSARPKKTVNINASDTFPKVI